MNENDTRLLRVGDVVWVRATVCVLGDKSASVMFFDSDDRLHNFPVRYDALAGMEVNISAERDQQNG